MARAMTPAEIGLLSMLGSVCTPGFFKGEWVVRLVIACHCHEVVLGTYTSIYEERGRISTSDVSHAQTRRKEKICELRPLVFVRT